MNNTNPFVPQGSILEQQSKRRSRLKLAVFCGLAVSVTGLAVMLIQGCKREQPVEADMTTPTIDTNLVAVADTNTPPAVDTNVPVILPPTTFTQPPVVTPPVEPAGSEYTIAKGDTFDKIAKLNHTTVKAIEAANPNVVPTKLRIGQKLVIPAGTATVTPATTTDAAAASTGATTYVVKSGDTLTHIAKLHGTTVKAIQAENNMATTTIYVGKKLKIPAKVTVAAPAPVVEPAPVVPAPAVVPAK